VQISRRAGLPEPGRISHLRDLSLPSLHRKDGIGQAESDQGRNLGVWRCVAMNLDHISVEYRWRVRTRTRHRN
jgi:hypothetical protein